MALDDQIRELLKTAHTIGVVGLMAEQAITMRAAVLWLQWSIIQCEAAQCAHGTGLIVVMDRCIKVEHQGWRGSEERRA